VIQIEGLQFEVKIYITSAKGKPFIELNELQRHGAYKMDAIGQATKLKIGK